MFFRQVQQHGDNFSYIIGDKNTGEAAIVDSSFNASKILQILNRDQTMPTLPIGSYGRQAGLLTSPTAIFLHLVL